MKQKKSQDGLNFIYTSEAQHEFVEGVLADYLSVVDAYEADFVYLDSLDGPDYTDLELTKREK